SRSSSRAAGACLAEREGFEPSRRSRAWRFSRPLPSTARPPLRAGDRRTAVSPRIVMQANGHLMQARSGSPRRSDRADRMARRRYRATRKRDRKGGDVWGVAAFEPQPGKPWRQVAWKTVGRDAQGEIEARALAIEMERQEAEHGERFLSWHVAGERLPLDRTVRDYVHHHSKAIGGSTARRYGQFGERLIARLGSLDLRDLREEDVAEFVTAEFRDRRAKDPTINATVLLRSVMRAALAARDVYRRAHLADDPLPRIATIARRTARKLWAPALDDEALAAAWTPQEVATVLGAARQDAP